MCVVVAPISHEFTGSHAEPLNDTILLHSLIILHILNVQGVRVVAAALEPLLIPQCPVLSVHNKYGSLARTKAAERILVNDDQQHAAILAYLFIYS